jgi:hypothetical protein
MVVVEPAELGVEQAVGNYAYGGHTHESVGLIHVMTHVLFGAY